jgi:Protein of unknown function (DUF3047)
MRNGFPVAVLTAVFVLAGCATMPDGPDQIALPYVKIFSKNQPAEAGKLPDGWRRWTISKFKKPTDYTLVDYDGRTVVKARANASASGLVHRLDIDPREFPVLAWQWKTTALISTADNRTKHLEDSPLRVVVTFAGDKDKLPFDERLFADNVRLMTKQEMPYATLMYIWENRAPVGSVLPNLHTARIKMIVAESGAAKVGRWHDIARNVVEDYRRAFGEEPGRITSVAVMTDTDNTGESVLAYYGDIAFRRGAAGAPGGTR